MSWIKRFFNLNIQDWWKQPVDDFDPDKVVCTFDESEEDCFIGKIESEGYAYDSGNDWWARTWTTESEPKSSIEEVYQRLENGKWKQLMIGYGDRVFYEEDVK